MLVRRSVLALERSLPRSTSRDALIAANFSVVVRSSPTTFSNCKSSSGLLNRASTWSLVTCCPSLTSNSSIVPSIRENITSLFGLHGSRCNQIEIGWYIEQGVRQQQESIKVVVGFSRNESLSFPTATPTRAPHGQKEYSVILIGIVKGFRALIADQFNTRQFRLSKWERLHIFRR